ncbi:choline kinase [Labrys miyagiensis]|uniref:Choline kinase n=1 Tax=Labrys miyagiensis TaxID=346912 RepID=A0ABQ6CV39_9HYPH|nr:choline/ethanolamine kinase family protein [Labrys miyagiensis]GLS24178.1 choline kinase [Labrys miyagiensis]
MHDLEVRLAALPIWSGPVHIEPLPGGMTNRNLLVSAPQGRFVVRIVGDNAAHDIDRSAEQAATRAAAMAGLCPELFWAEPDLMVLRHVAGHTLGRANFEDKNTLSKTVDLLRNTYRKLPLYYEGPKQDRRLITILVRYADALTRGPGRWRGAVESHRPLLSMLAPRLADIPQGFAHNDVHGDNLIDDGSRLWLVDWEYAGQGQPLADIASLANNALMTENAANAALELWLGRTANDRDRASFAAMRLAAALRDLFWGYAQDSAQEGSGDQSQTDLVGYIGINEDRVKVAIARL